MITHAWLNRSISFFHRSCVMSAENYLRNITSQNYFVQKLQHFDLGGTYFFCCVYIDVHVHTYINNRILCPGISPIIMIWRRIHAFPGIRMVTSSKFKKLSILERWNSTVFYEQVSVLTNTLQWRCIHNNMDNMIHWPLPSLSVPCIGGVCNSYICTDYPIEI